MKMAAISLPMNQCDQECDLGVLFTPAHKLITCKANSVIGIIKRSFSCLDRTMFCTLCISLICPHLEYSAEIWNPYLRRDIQTLEKKVQRRATKLIPELRDLNYTNRLVAQVFYTDAKEWTWLLFSKLFMVSRKFHLRTCFSSTIPSLEAMDTSYINIYAI